MERYSAVIGLPVICIDDGKRLGIIEDVIFCPRQKEVKAFLLERKRCRISKKVILMEDVVSLGKDALIVNDCTCIQNLRNLENSDVLKEKNNIKGFRIYTKTGEDIGIVKDILFDYKIGLIEGVEVSDGLFHDLVKGRNLLPLCGKVEFGEDNILVEREAVEEMMETGGGLKKKLLQE